MMTHHDTPPARKYLMPPQAIEDAEKGIIPPAPDLSAKTHEKYRPLLFTCKVLAQAGDLEGLKRMAIEPKSSSRRVINRYRELCIKALMAARPKKVPPPSRRKIEKPRQS
jgi:hypothetical protein